ncbi:MULTISPECIES: helix-turn-helix transcriptional regulator, partial [unclassified Streptomyces]|uniref:helix-turn-helix domain-containing protein n=1 Tax=unclassified Streptomyces TaxID=2593676 RepID=UPI001BE55FAA
MIAIVNEESSVAARPFGVVGGADLPDRPGVAPPSRTVRQLLGVRMKALRKAAKLTIAQVVAKGAVSSDAVLSRIETGNPKVNVNHALINRLLKCYEVTDQDALRSVRLRVEQLLSDAKPRWAAHDGLVAGDFADLLHMEAAADRITVFETMFVTGMLQTPAYMDAVMTHPCLSEQEREQADRRQRLRKERQRLLESADAPEFTAIIDEAVLHRTVGSRAVMREQLRTLFSLCERTLSP